MTVRLLYGVSIAVLMLLSGAVFAPLIADQPPASLPSAPAHALLAATVVQLAAMTEGVAQVASAAQIIVPPAAESVPSAAEIAPLVPTPLPQMPPEAVKADATHRPAKNKVASIADGLPRGERSHRGDSVNGGAKLTQVKTVGPRETGTAAWYGGRYLGRRTSSGERLDSIHATAAHRTLPLNTLVRVTNLKNGRSVVVRITDRGPVSEALLIDLSPKAAEELAMKTAGIVPVAIEQVVEVSADAR